MQYQVIFEQSLSAKDPIEELRRFALQLGSEGKARQEIYEIFLEYYGHLQANERETDEHKLGDVMDMIMGQYAPFNLNFPEDEQTS